MRREERERRKGKEEGGGRKKGGGVGRSGWLTEDQICKGISANCKMCVIMLFVIVPFFGNLFKKYLITWI